MYSAKAPGRFTPTPDVFDAQVAAAGTAVAADAAGDVALCGHPVARCEADHLAADGLHDLAAELVAHRHRHRDGLPRPVVPLEDVDVGAADRGAVDADQHVVVAHGSGRATSCSQMPRSGSSLDQRLHAAPTHTQFAADFGERVDGAVEVCTRVPADICVRMRASPFGTTG
jgi:hypothetical protein